MTSKLQFIAERIAKTKAKLDAEADKLSDRLDAIDKEAPAIFERSNDFLDEQKKDVAVIEATLRQLSNLPFDGNSQQEK